MGDGDRRRRIGGDRLLDGRSRLEQRKSNITDHEDRELHGERAHGEHERDAAAARHAGDETERERERQRAQDRVGEEEDATAMERRLDRRVDHDVERAEQQDAAGGERGPAAPALVVHLERDQHDAEVRDLRAGEGQEVRQAPEGHVDPEEAVPQVVDGRGEDGNGDAPPRQVKATRPGEAHDRLGVWRRRSTPRPPRLQRQDAERDDRGRGDGGVRHHVGSDPERIAADQQVPADVPAHAPAADELRREQGPERSAPEGHPHGLMLHFAPQ